jgi:hypothetical protein
MDMGCAMAPLFILFIQGCQGSSRVGVWQTWWKQGTYTVSVAKLYGERRVGIIKRGENNVESEWIEPAPDRL